MRVGSLFAGIGGFDLAARNVGWSTAWYSEIDPFAIRVMAKNFPDAVNLGDITTITNPPHCDVLVGGFPCQDVSYAGDGAGIAVGTRSGLWYEFARIIAEIRPRWVVVENVAALRTRGLDTVLRSLDALGYVGEWHCIPAAFVGAPHRRDRLWVVARRIKFAADCPPCPTCDDEAWCDEHEQHYADCACLGPSSLDDTECEGLEGYAGHGDCSEGRSLEGGPATPSGFLLRTRTPEQQWEDQPTVGRVDYGLSARVVCDELTALGNAIVPQVAEFLFRAINDAEGDARREGE